MLYLALPLSVLVKLLYLYVSFFLSVFLFSSSSSFFFSFSSSFFFFYLLLLLLLSSSSSSLPPPPPSSVCLLVGLLFVLLLKVMPDLISLYVFSTSLSPSWEKATCFRLEQPPFLCSTCSNLALNHNSKLASSMSLTPNFQLSPVCLE